MPAKGPKSKQVQGFRSGSAQSQKDSAKANEPNVKGRSKARPGTETTGEPMSHEEALDRADRIKRRPGVRASQADEEVALAYRKAGDFPTVGRRIHAAKKGHKR